MLELKYHIQNQYLMCVNMCIYFIRGHNNRKTLIYNNNKED